MVPLTKMQVGAADRAGGDPHDRVAGILDLRVRDLIDRDLADVVPDDSLHLCAPPCGLPVDFLRMVHPLAAGTSLRPIR
jgi:hypothetical protein